MQRWMLAAVLAALAGCASQPSALYVTPPLLTIEPETGWKAIVSGEDNARLAALPDTWSSALDAAKRYRSQIGREGDLLVADAARNHPAPPPGSYRCRLVKLGTPTRRDPAFRAFPEFFCYIRGDRADALFFTKQTGSELPEGWLHADGDRRLVLTGARQHEGKGGTLVYGSEPDRDIVGVMERVGPFRWRLVLPWRGTEKGLDIYEMVPVAQDQQAAEPPAILGDDKAASPRPLVDTLP